MSADVGHAVFQQLQEEGWSLKEQAPLTPKQEALSLLEGENVSAAVLRSALLDTDLRKVGLACLPQDINKADGRPLKGPHVLQLMSAQDISIPTKGGSTTAKQRMLMVKLTDGKVTVKGLEFKPCTRLNTDKLPPGSKVVVRNASIKAGIVLLDDKSLQVLGGHVEALAESWDFERKFGATQRPAESLSDSMRPPLFTRFVPGKTQAPRQYLPASTAEPSKSAGKPPGLEDRGTHGQHPTEPQPPNAEPGRDAEARGVAGGVCSAPIAAMSESHTDGAVLDRARAQGTAKLKLLERLTGSEEGRGRWGRGGRRGRVRRGRHDDDGDAGMTLVEWEAKQKNLREGTNVIASGVPHLDADEALARQLQAELDMEDMEYYAEDAQPSRSTADELKRSLFAYDDTKEERSFRGRRGRGRGRARGPSRGHYPS